MEVMRTTKPLWCVLSFAALALAQADTARIAGLVTDATGAVIPNATITVQNDKTGEQRTVNSNDSGYYIVTNLAPTTYSVTSKAQGLGPAQYTEIRLTVGQERNLNIILQPASLTQEVTVSGGELTVVDTSSARIGANVNEREVANLPLNGRQV